MSLIIWSCNGKNQSANTSDNNSDSVESKDINHVLSQNGDNLTKVDLSEADRKELNTFFSNFSEVLMKPFNLDKLTDALMIHFAVYHNEINYFKLFQPAGNNRFKISEYDINQTTEIFFGRKVGTHQSTNEIIYSQGFYTIVPADGEAYYFSQIDDLFLIEGNNYYAMVKIYVAGSGWTGDPHAKPAAWDTDDVPQLDREMVANIVKVDDRYILTEYLNVSE